MGIITYFDSWYHWDYYILGFLVPWGLLHTLIPGTTGIIIYLDFRYHGDYYVLGFLVPLELLCTWILGTTGIVLYSISWYHVLITMRSSYLTGVFNCIRGKSS